MIILFLLYQIQDSHWFLQYQFLLLFLEFLLFKEASSCLALLTLVAIYAHVLCIGVLICMRTCTCKLFSSDSTFCRILGICIDMKVDTILLTMIIMWVLFWDCLRVLTDPCRKSRYDFVLIFIQMIAYGLLILLKVEVQHKFTVILMSVLHQLCQKQAEPVMFWFFLSHLGLRLII